MTFVLLDIGGTHTRVATAADTGTLTVLATYKTPATARAGIDTAIAAVQKAAVGKVDQVVVGVRGVINDARTGIENDGILKKWLNQPIVSWLESAFSAPVTLENDTALAGLGEAVYGAGKGAEIVAYHTISTGVGGVKLEHGKIDESSFGFEPGHQIVDIDRTILGQDVTPTLENLVSGSALEQRFGVKAYEIPQSDVLWDELAEYLAQGLRNTTLYWSPDVIVLGGAMILGQPHISIDAIRKHTVEALDGFVECPFITTAALGDESGLHGALARAVQQHTTVAKQ